MAKLCFLFNRRTLSATLVKYEYITAEQEPAANHKPSSTTFHSNGIADVSLEHILQKQDYFNGVIDSI